MVLSGILHLSVPSPYISRAGTRPRAIVHGRQHAAPVPIIAAPAMGSVCCPAGPASARLHGTAAVDRRCAAAGLGRGTAAIVAVVLLVQLAPMRRLLADPHQLAACYAPPAVPSFGMIATALALGVRMTLGWVSIVRIGVAQTALGAAVVLCTATINRIMIVELALLAVLAAALVGIYHGCQLLRPYWGHRADQGMRRTHWVIGGMALLAAGTIGAATATAWMETARLPGLALAVISFAALGLGFGAAATNLLAMLAANVAPGRKAAAGSLVWTMMIAGMAASGIAIGQVLDPYSGARLVQVSCAVAAVSLGVTALALSGVEPDGARMEPRPKVGFREAVLEVFRDRRARLFAILVLVSTLAYNTQDLILEPYGGHVFGMTPGESTALGGTLYAGAVAGMVLFFALGLYAGRGYHANLSRTFVIAGCITSGFSLVALAVGGLADEWPLRLNVVVLGFCNGIFAVAAVSAMMELAGEGTRAREGTRMGVFGAAQSTGLALGASCGAAMLDLLRWATGLLAEAYAAVFVLEGVLFLVAAALAVRAIPVRAMPSALPVPGQ
jgi:MFS transporter, BCD family, chlorophyll transporter